MYHSFKVRNEVPHLYKTRSKIINFYTFTFLVTIYGIQPSGAHIVGTGSGARELPSAWGYSWATRSQGDINSGDWSSRFGVGRKASDLTLENISCG
jgi:hypothetical protein